MWVVYNKPDSIQKILQLTVFYPENYTSEYLLKWIYYSLFTHNVDYYVSMNMVCCIGLWCLEYGVLYRFMVFNPLLTYLQYTHFSSKTYKKYVSNNNNKV